MADRPDDAVEQIDDPFVRRVSDVAGHVGRHALTYVVGLLLVLSLVALPVVNSRADDKSKTDAASSSLEAGGTDARTDVTAAPDPSTEQAAAPGAAAAAPGTRTQNVTTGGAGGVKRTVKDSVSVARVQTGKTRGGLDCRPGVNQIPISRYAAVCTAAFEGTNGGATYMGVTPTEIRIVRRRFPESANSRAVDAVVAQAGGASRDTNRQIRDEVWLPYFNKMYETYGRKVVYIDYESKNGDSTQEALGKGREGACADATEIQTQLKPFMITGSTGQTFSECAAERKMIVISAGAYFPESWYRQHHPYLWQGIMECERISYQLSEYIGKRLMNKPARWAGDPVLREQKRKFGTYVPDNDGYQQCTKITEKVLHEKYGGEEKPARYNYQLDVSRFPDQAAQAMVQFKAAGVTSVVTACDPISIIFMTQAAHDQRYFPEWIGIGTALQDTDNAARLYDQEEVNGHLFGMSQLGSTDKLLGPNSEPGQMYKFLTGKEIPPGATGDYYAVVGQYNIIQGVGPNPTPQALAEALWTAPPRGGPDYPVGYVSYQDSPDGRKGGRDHTAVDDAREVYWVSEPGTPTGTQTKPRDPYYAGKADGYNGTYKETYGGRRFRNGEWPAEDPPIYPKR